MDQGANPETTSSMISDSGSIKKAASAEKLPAEIQVNITFCTALGHQGAASEIKENGHSEQGNSGLPR